MAFDVDAAFRQDQEISERRSLKLSAAARAHALFGAYPVALVRPSNSLAERPRFRFLRRNHHVPAEFCSL